MASVRARVSALAGVVLFTCQAASASGPYTSAPYSTGTDVYHRPHFRAHTDWIKPSWTQPWVAPSRFASRPIDPRPIRFSAQPPDQFETDVGRGVRPLTYQPEFDAPRGVRPLTYQPEFNTLGGTRPQLSYPAWRVSQIAARRGDRNFLMIDKAHGQIFLFQNGVPVFSGDALTGASLADRLPPDAMSKSFAQEQDVRYRVTPAGRFTVSPGYDRALGATLDINEIKGRDWTIAIHTVVLGARAGYRDARLRSPLDRDKHITEGCINVDADTMRQLARLVPRWGHMPLYILPNDERLITEMF
jgi:hypothetical protein